MRRKRLLSAASLLCLALVHPAFGQLPFAQRPAPDVVDAKYGPHERNLLDLWKAKSEKPTPVVVHFHGGGFREGDKVNIPTPFLRECLAAGISVASANYRLSHHAPFPAPMLDGARAVQFLRFRAKEWNLDPRRIAASGGSAGGGISLWVGFHDEMADAKSEDPVSRQSSRLSCMAVTSAQTSYDPRWIAQNIGGRAHEHPALLPFFGLKKEEAHTGKAHKLYEEASPIAHLTADDPPAFLYYTESKRPLTPSSPVGAGIHHIKFGEMLKEKMAGLGIECVVKHRDDYGRDAPTSSVKEMMEFLVRCFKSGAENR